MSIWHTFPKNSWSQIGKILSGFSQGEGAYKIAYAMNADTAKFLNGRVSASIHLAKHQAFQGAGVIARANRFRSFVAFAVVTDATNPDLYSVRLMAFKEGANNVLVGINQPIHIPNREFSIALQFFSGDMVGQVQTSQETYTLKHVLPEIPFPGYCGVIRYYSSSVVARNIQIEKITMKPILPEESQEDTKRTYPFCVFLSHASADKQTVLEVIEALKKAGIPFWVDHEQINFGDGIVAKIEEGLQNSKYVVVCLSKNLAKSGWCRAEYSPILGREFSGDTSRRVIPLSLDGSQDKDAIPLLLSDKLRADFTNKANFSSFIDFLQKSM